MATSSILTNVIISDSKKAEAFADALEASCCDAKQKTCSQPIPILNDTDEIQRFLSKKGMKV